jgi:hypothetical protein
MGKIMDIETKGRIVNKISSKKFIFGLIAYGFTLVIFIVMLIFKWLTAAYCMTFVSNIPIILMVIVGGNSLDKFIKSKNGK